MKKAKKNKKNMFSVLSFGKKEESFFLSSILFKWPSNTFLKTTGWAIYIKQKEVASKKEAARTGDKNKSSKCAHAS